MDNFIEKVIDDSLKIWNGDGNNNGYFYTDNSSKNITIYNDKWDILKKYVDKGTKFIFILSKSLEEIHYETIWKMVQECRPKLRVLSVWLSEEGAENYRVLIPNIAFYKIGGCKDFIISDASLGCGNFFIADPKRTIIYNKDLKAKDETGRINEVKTKILEDKVAELTEKMEKISNLLR